MEIKKLIQDILSCYANQDRIGLDVLLWLYHKEVAKSHKLDPYKYGWFMELTKLAPQVELQRSAVDILKGYQQLNKEAKLPNVLDETLKELIKKLQDYLNK